MCAFLTPQPLEESRIRVRVILVSGEDRHRPTWFTQFGARTFEIVLNETTVTLILHVVLWNWTYRYNFQESFFFGKRDQGVLRCGGR